MSYFHDFNEEDGFDDEDDFDFDLSRQLSNLDRELESASTRNGSPNAAGEEESHGYFVDFYSEDEDEDMGFEDLGSQMIEGPLEGRPATTLAKLLIEEGTSLPAPESMTDDALHTKLWKVIYGMEKLHTYLYHTDHLSDRDLYQILWNVILNEPSYDLRKFPEAACHIDSIPIDGEDEYSIWLRFYASDDERREFAREFGKITRLPPKEKPPFDRDRYLPERPEMGG